jgi:hypothetical protein
VRQDQDMLASGMPGRHRELQRAAEEGGFRLRGQDGTANGARGDELAVMPDGPLVTDVSVVHPAS